MGGNSLWLPEQASTFAPSIDSLFYFVTWVSTILFIMVIGGMVYFMFKYRRQNADERPDPIKENKLVEISWIVLPTILVLIVFTWGFQGYVRLNVAPPESYEIKVYAQKWNWRFEYPNGYNSTNEVVVPQDRPVRFHMVSEDVLHSFYLPSMRVKQDVLPNRYSSVWFEATKTDTFQVFCTEYCGTEHSSMFAQLVALPQDEFNDWLESAGDDPNKPLPEVGEDLYNNAGCQGCHSLDGSRRVGPSFAELFGSERNFTDGTSAQADDDYIRESIVAPQTKIVEGYEGIMPSYSYLTERQVSGLVEFIKSQN